MSYLASRMIYRAEQRKKILILPLPFHNNHTISSLPITQINKINTQQYLAATINTEY